MKEVLLTTTRKGGGYEFIGELDGSFITYQALSDAFSFTQGSPNTSTSKDTWLNFRINGKQLVVAKVGVRGYVSYNDIYSNGLVYGTDDNGLLVPTYNYSGGPVNQYRTIQIQNRLYKCRILRGTNTDPATGISIDDNVESEFSKIFYPLIRDDPNIPDRNINAPYTTNELWFNTTGPGTFTNTWCQESFVNQPNNRIMRGGLGITTTFNYVSNFVYSSHSWRPVLELIS